MQSNLHLSYKPAKLYFAKGDLTKEWYVWYSYCKPGEIDQYDIFRERFDMNRIPDLEGRFAYGQEAVKFMNEKLKAGFNPYLAFASKKFSMDISIIKQLNIILDELCDGESDNARRDITSHCNRFEKYLVEKKLIEMHMGQFTVEHAEAFKTWLNKEKEFSKKTINSSLTYISRFFKVANRKKWCVLNHIDNVEKLKKKQYRKDKPEREKFDPITSTEMDKIFSILIEKKEFDFIAYLSMIFYAWARPSEIRRLKVGDIDLKNDIIKFSKNDTKSFAGAYVQIVPPLKQILTRLNLHNYPIKYYLFGRDNCKPGEGQLGKNFAGEKWKALVKEPMDKEGLEIDKDMYALKHTGNIEYLLRNKGNVDLKWQQMQNRHSSSTMTDKYNRKLGAYFIEVGELNFRLFE